MQSRFEPFRPDAPTIPEVSSGALIVGEDSKRVLLLHEIAEDRWCFPKGHVDPGESLGTAALREIREETGLDGVRLAEEIGEITYRYYDPARGVNVLKVAVYFLARAVERAPTLEPIFDRAEWVEIGAAGGRIRWERDRQILDAARRLLRRPPPLPPSAARNSESGRPS